MVRREDDISLCVSFGCRYIKFQVTAFVAKHQRSVLAQTVLACLIRCLQMPQNGTAYQIHDQLLPTETRKQPYVCCHCAGPEASQDQQALLNYKVVLPMCTNCTEKAAVVRQPRKRRPPNSSYLHCSIHNF